MVAVIQKVTSAKVEVEGNITGEIKQGLLILLGVAIGDTEAKAVWLAEKVANLRVFLDDQEKMNLSVKDVNGEALVVSQFTLLARTKKGTRPSFTDAAPPSIANPLYEFFCSQMETHLQKPTQKGVFGAMMQVSLTNDGPVTILIDTESLK